MSILCNPKQKVGSYTSTALGRRNSFFYIKFEQNKNQHTNFEYLFEKNKIMSTKQTTHIISDITFVLKKNMHKPCFAIPKRLRYSFLVVIKPLLGFFSSTNWKLSFFLCRLCLHVTYFRSEFRRGSNVNNIVTYSAKRKNVIFSLTYSIID